MSLKLCEISRFLYMGENPVKNEDYAANQNPLYLKLWIILMIFLLKIMQKIHFLKSSLVEVRGKWMFRCHLDLCGRDEHKIIIKNVILVAHFHD